MFASSNERRSKMLTYTKQKTKPGSTQQVINVDRDGKPFGQIWTFRDTKDTWHPWHAKPLNGQHVTFTKGRLGEGDQPGSLQAAKAYMEAEAKK
jgi:hypothetical protein